MIKKIIFTDRSNELLTSYLRDIAKYKILSGPEMASCILEAQNGDNNAREKVIKSNLRFVVTVAKQFQNRGIPLMDLISSGSIGLIKAIDKFDVNRGVTFLSYAVWWIKQEIFNTIYWNGRDIRLPMSQQLNIIKILDTTNTFFHNNGRIPSPEEISELTEIPVEQIDFLSQFSNRSLSVDEYIGGDEDNSQVGDIIPDEEELAEDTINKEYVSSELEKIIKLLPIREHDVIKMYFGIGMPVVNPKVIAEMYGVSGERIRQIKEGALARLRRVHNKKLKALL